MMKAKTKKVEARDVMEFLRRLLKASWSPALRTAQPIVFDFIRERWTLDPAQANPVIQGDVANPVLTVHAAPDSLMSLLTQPGYTLSPYEVFMNGDVSAFDPLIEALSVKKNVLALRASKGF